MPPRNRGRSAPRRSYNWLLDELGWSELSWPVVGWTLVVLAVGFGPLLIINLTEVAGVGRKLLVALGPALVCMAFAGLTWKYGMETIERTGHSRQYIWLVTAMFVGLAGLVGWLLFVSV